MIVALALLLGGGVAAAPPPDVATHDLGIRLAREGRCEAALPELAKARAADPADAAASLVAGQCLLRLQRYDPALGALEEARARAPQLPGLDVSLAMVHYHLGHRAEARAALERAEARDPDRASVQLYRGLLLLDDAETEAGVAALERARRLDPDYAEPVSSFYQGLALERIDERERARTALARVVQQWPGTAWAEEASRALTRLDAPRHPWWLKASLGAEYDSNVVLRGSGVPLPDDISDEGDWRGVWTLSAGAVLFQSEAWTAGLAAGYYGTKQDRVDQYDTQYPTVSLWLDHPFTDDTVGRLRYEFGYAWVDGDPYLAEHVFEGQLFRAFRSAGRTRLSLRYQRDDFRFDTFDVPGGDGTPGDLCPLVPGFGQPVECGPPGLDEGTARNRDGWEVAAGVRHDVALPALPGLSSPGAWAGYEYAWYDARGREYSFQQHALRWGVSAVLPYEVTVETEAGFAYRPYRHPSTFPDPPTGGNVEYSLAGTDRREHEWTVGASLGRALGKHLRLSLDWSYDHNESTAAVFDYHRHVVGLHLQGSLGE